MTCSPGSDWAGSPSDAPASQVVEAGTPPVAATPWTAGQRAAYAGTTLTAADAPRSDPPPPLSDAMRLAALDSYRRSLVTSVS